MKEDGSRQITAFHIAGEMADLYSAVWQPGIRCLTALCDTVALGIPRIALRSLTRRYPAIAEAFWRDCGLDAEILMQWAVNVGRKTAVSRIAHILCEMAWRYAGAERGPLCAYTLPIVQQQLADATAITAVHVNRSLRSLRNAGIVTFRSGNVNIHSWKELAYVGEFDPAYLAVDSALAFQKYTKVSRTK